MTEEQKERGGVYLELPKGFKQPGKVLRLKRYLYGLRNHQEIGFYTWRTNLPKLGSSRVNMLPAYSYQKN
jgi:hypothetical protein